MTIPTFLILVGLLFALFDEFQAQGHSLLGWAVVAIALALLWGTLNI